jgi:hypothetical protein
VNSFAKILVLELGYFGVRQNLKKAKIPLQNFGSEIDLQETFHLKGIA